MENCSDFKEAGSYVKFHGFSWDEALIEKAQQDLSDYLWNEQIEGDENEDYVLFLNLVDSFMDGEEIPDEESDYSDEKIALMLRWEKKRPSAKIKRTKFNHKGKYRRQKDPCSYLYPDYINFKLAKSHNSILTLLTKRDDDESPAPITEAEFTPYPGEYYEHEAVWLIVESNNPNYIGVAHIHGTSHKFHVELRVA